MSKVAICKVAITLEAYHAVEIIEEAFARFGLPEIVNTDQSSQFTASDFTDAVLNKGCKLSMDGRGAWRGDLEFCHNVFVERVWRSAKYERIYFKAYDGITAARADIADHFSWYNTERPHSSLDRITPQHTNQNCITKEKMDRGDMLSGKEGMENCKSVLLQNDSRNLAVKMICTESSKAQEKGKGMTTATGAGEILVRYSVVSSTSLKGTMDRTMDVSGG